MTGIGSPSSGTFCVGKKNSWYLKDVFPSSLKLFLLLLCIFWVLLCFLFFHALSTRWRVECSPPHSLSVAVRFRIESHPERLRLSRNQVFYSVSTRIWHRGELRALWSLAVQRWKRPCARPVQIHDILIFVPRRRGITLPSWLPVVPLPAVMVLLECWSWNTEQYFVNFSGPVEVRNCFCTSF